MARKVNSDMPILVKELLKSGNSVYDEMYLWDTNGDTPRLILSMINGKVSMNSQELYDRFLAKASTP
jgi:hypothetical protein